MDTTAAKKSDKLSPIVKEKQITISDIAPDLDLSFSEEQYLKMQKGFIPKAMEDKWYIYFENDCLHFHRSWTGLEIFRAEIVKANDGGEDRKYAIKEFYFETDKEIYNAGDDASELDILIQLIFVGLLEIDMRSHYIGKYGSGTPGAVKTWSIFGRMLVN